MIKYVKKKYTDRGIRKILAKYSEEAGLTQNLSPHKLRHFLLTWLKKQGIDDALIQPYSGHESRKSLEVYSKLGFEIEGTKRKAGIRGGKYIDEYIMARLRDI